MEYYIGVDLGGTNIKAGIADDAGNIIYKDMAPTYAERHYSEIIRDMAELIKKVISNSGVDRGLVKSIGIGSPGTCDRSAGKIIYAPNISLSNVNVRGEMEKYFDLPIFVENDANCAALGEYRALDEKVSDMVLVTLGTGVGGGIILGGKLFTAQNGTATELGHMIIDPHGIKCNCGANGCWERYASVTALIRMTGEYVEQNPDSAVAAACKGGISGKTAFDLMKKGDMGAKSIVDKWIFYVGTGIISIINILQPEVIVIGGAISKEGDALINPIRKMQEGNVYSKIENKTQLKIAKLGNDAGLIGSAFLGKYGN